MFTIFVHNFAHNFCTNFSSKNSVSNFCSQILCITLVNNFCSKFLFKTIVHNFCSKLLIKSFDQIFCLTTYRMSPKKRGISECGSVCSTAHLMLNLEYSFKIHLKIQIHMFAPSTKSFLSNIREPSKTFFKFRFKINYYKFDFDFNHNNTARAYKCIVNKKWACWVNKLVKH